MATVSFKPIIPPPLNIAAMREALKESVVEAGFEMDYDFQKTVATWNTQVEFTQEYKESAHKMTATVRTANKIYAYVTLGTPPHIIRPKRRGGVLRFKSGYRAKTVPQFIGSVNGGPHGDTVYSTVVYHPGTEAREFVETEAEEMEPKFVELVEAGMARAAQESGHAL